ncbi:MAG: hypothetical protein ACWGPS_08755, partial [Candidatus Promineifilaceae bacterium]
MRDFENPEAIGKVPQEYPYREEVPAPYRYQRILYPFVARLLALGRPTLVPWTLILLNIAAIGVGTYATELVLLHFGVSHWYALAYGLYGGQTLGLRTNLNEPLTFALVQLAILAWLDRRLVSSAACFAEGCMSNIFIIANIRIMTYIVNSRGAVPSFVRSKFVASSFTSNSWPYTFSRMAYK